MAARAEVSPLTAPPRRPGSLEGAGAGAESALAGAAVTEPGAAVAGAAADAGAGVLLFKPDASPPTSPGTRPWLSAEAADDGAAAAGAEAAGEAAAGDGEAAAGDGAAAAGAGAGAEAAGAAADGEAGGLVFNPDARPPTSPGTRPWLSAAGADEGAAAAGAGAEAAGEAVTGAAAAGDAGVLLLSPDARPPTSPGTRPSLFEEAAADAGLGLAG